MATRRMINKDDCESVAFTRLTIRQRYLYKMLMLYADDDGVIPVVMVRPKAFPCDEISNEDISMDLTNLQTQGFIQLYLTESGDNYLIISDWWKKQNIRKDYYKQTVHPKPKNYVNRPDDNRKSSKAVTQPLSNSYQTVQRVSQINSSKEKNRSVHLEEGFQRAGDIYKNLN